MRDAFFGRRIGFWLMEAHVRLDGCVFRAWCSYVGSVAVFLWCLDEDEVVHVLMVQQPVWQRGHSVGDPGGHDGRVGHCIGKAFEEVHQETGLRLTQDMLVPMGEPGGRSRTARRAHRHVQCVRPALAEHVRTIDPDTLGERTEGEVVTRLGLFRLTDRVARQDGKFAMLADALFLLSDD